MVQSDSISKHCFIDYIMDIIEITAIDQDEEIQQLLMDMKKLYIEMIVQKLITGVGLSLLVIISTIL